MAGCRVFDGTEYEGMTLGQFRDAVARKDMTVGTLADLLAKLPRDRPVVILQDDGTETNLRMLLCAHDDSTDTFDPVCRLYAGPRKPEPESPPDPDQSCYESFLRLYGRGQTYSIKQRRDAEAKAVNDCMKRRRRALENYRGSKTLEERVAHLEELHQDRLMPW